jgi:hypothetical protein
MLMLAGCTFASRASPPPTPGKSVDQSPPLAASVLPSSSATYEVVAALLHPPGSSNTFACDVVETSYPPAGCSGVALAGYDFERLPGVSHTVGWWQTGPMLVVGTWDGHTLTVTQPPSPRRTQQPEPSPPASCTGRTRQTAILGAKIARDGEKLNLMIVQACWNTVWILVPVADDSTVAYVHDHFGPRVLVSGWLHPHSQGYEHRLT